MESEKPHARISWQQRFIEGGKASASRIFISTCRSFNSRETTVSFASREENREYYRGVLLSSSGLALTTENFLRGNLMFENFTEDPADTLEKIMAYYRLSGNPESLVIAADVCRYLADREKPEQAIHFHLSSYRFCWQYVQYWMKNTDSLNVKDYYATALLVQLGNEAMAGIFRFLKMRLLLNLKIFSLAGIDGSKFTIDDTDFKLSVPSEAVEEFSLCSDYRIHRLLLINRHPGFGVPLVARLSSRQLNRSLKNPGGLTIPVTLWIQGRELEDGTLKLTLHFTDTSLRETLTPEDIKKANSGDWTLARDFSTPIACMLNGLKERNLLGMMLDSSANDDETGLYMVEPYDPGKIPVVFIHGLMSSPETWGQMANFLKSESHLRSKYQFWFFAYSTGTPVLYSATKLHDALLDAQQEFCTTPEQCANFNRMVLVGHSMGGLIARTLLQRDPYFIAGKIGGMPWREIVKKMDEKECKLLKRYLIHEPLSFVNRVIFMATPHRGAAMAHSPIAHLGTRLIKLPATLNEELESGRRILAKLLPNERVCSKDFLISGIENLRPDNLFIRAVGDSPMKEGLAIHTIIGNCQADGVPGGSDGVVPYGSSHLDSAVSELIVRSNHSVHQRPAAIREVLRILLVHLNECGITEN